MYVLNKCIGNFGEKAAEAYLKQEGYTILENNFKCKIGEIDIIAQDGDYITFVEVKTRYSQQFGIPAEAITYKKQVRIIKSAQIYILKKKLFNIDFRFDVIQVMTNTNNDTISIDLIKNAFQVST